MRHRKAGTKLGKDSSHHRALVADLICGLIQRKRITTTLQKANMTRQTADKMVTLAKQGTVAARRRAVAALRQAPCVRELFENIVPQLKARQGGYTRVVKLGHRGGDGAEMALLEWVDIAPAVKVVAETPAKSDKKT